MNTLPDAIAPPEAPSLDHASRFYVPEPARMPESGIESTRVLPPFDDAATLVTEKLPRPPAIVEGLLRRGEKAVLGGPSKSFKSWASLDLAVCVSHGIAWLGRRVVPGRVLMVNLELPRWCIAERIKDIAAARGVVLRSRSLLSWTLRGQRVTAERLHAEIIKRNAENFALIVIDPAYKLLEKDDDENSPTDIGGMLGSIEALANDTGAAVLVPAHFAKGTASSKASQDRISGSGVWARDPDSIVTLTPHEKEGAFTFEATLRTFPPVAPFVVRWSHPLLVRDESLDPARLKKSGGGRQKVHDSGRLLAAIADSSAENPVSISAWAKKVDVPRQTLTDYLREFRNKGWVETLGEGNTARQHITEDGREVARSASKEA